MASKAAMFCQPSKLPLNSPLIRPMRSNEIVQPGDYWLLNETWRLITGLCAYDPGCCTSIAAGDKNICTARLVKRRRKR